MAPITTPVRESMSTGGQTMISPLPNQSFIVPNQSFIVHTNRFGKAIYYTTHTNYTHYEVF